MIKSTVKEIVSLTKAAYFLPYAGFFTEKAKRDIYIKKNNVKRSIYDFEEIYHEQLLNIWKNDQFVFKSNKLTSKSNLERHNSHNLVEDFYEDIFNKIEVSDFYLENYFLKSSFRDKLKIYVQLLGISKTGLFIFDNHQVYYLFLLTMYLWYKGNRQFLLLKFQICFLFPAIFLSFASHPQQT